MAWFIQNNKLLTLNGKARGCCCPGKQSWTVVSRGFMGTGYIESTACYQEWVQQANYCASVAGCLAQVFSSSHGVAGSNAPLSPANSGISALVTFGQIGGYGTMAQAGGEGRAEIRQILEVVPTNSTLPFGNPIADITFASLSSGTSTGLYTTAHRFTGTSDVLPSVTGLSSWELNNVSAGYGIPVRRFVWVGGYLTLDSVPNVDCASYKDYDNNDVWRASAYGYATGNWSSGSSVSVTNVREM